MFTIDWLKTEFEKKDRLEYLFFRERPPHKDGFITSIFLSQWCGYEFESEGVIIKSTEHWMIYGTDKLFNDSDTADQISKCKSPGKTKALDRKVSNFDNDIWNQNLMYESPEILSKRGIKNLPTQHETTNFS